MRRVDVVVPCYNYARYLNACVRSILNQEGVSVRVLIIDDASDDDSAAVGQALAAADSRVTYRWHAVNRGHIATYNEGLLEWAAADYSLLISADDLLAEGALARATRLMDADESIGMTYGMAVSFVGDRPTPRNTTREPGDRCVVSGQSFLDYCFRAAANPVPTPTVVVRTALQKELGGYDSQFPHTGDMEMWMRFASRARIGVLRAVQAYYRYHERNMSSQYYLQVLGDRRERVLTFRHVLHTRLQHWSLAHDWSVALHKAAATDAFWAAVRAFEDGRAELCRCYLAFAAELDSRLPHSASWRRLRIKMWIGRSASSLVTRLLECWRRKSGGSQPTEGIAGALASDSIQGWWPALPKGEGAAQFGQ